MVQNAVADDLYRPSAEQPPQFLAAHGQHRQKDLGRNQGQNGHQAMEQRNVQILHGHRGHSGDQNGYDKLGGLHFGHLPFAHQPEGCNDEDVKKNGAEKRNQHRDITLC